MSSYQFVVNTPGRFPTGCMQESSTYRFHGVTLYNDADTTGTIWVENQVSLEASETFLVKEIFE